MRTLKKPLRKPQEMTCDICIAAAGGMVEGPAAVAGLERPGEAGQLQKRGPLKLPGAWQLNGRACAQHVVVLQRSCWPNVASLPTLQASQDFDPNGRTVVNKAEVFGENFFVTANGTYEPQVSNDRKTCNAHLVKHIAQFHI